MNKSLWHYTCTHAQVGIDRERLNRPRIHPFLPELGPVVWLTDLDELPSPDAVGLTATYLACDRTAVRYEVSRFAPGIRWWPWARWRCDPAVVADLESFGQPAHWWISTEPIAVSQPPQATT